MWLNLEFACGASSRTRLDRIYAFHTHPPAPAADGELK